MEKKYGMMSKTINEEAKSTGRIRKYKSNASKKANACDCGRVECPGCWEDCEKCGSNKCSQFCRVGRKYSIEWMKSD